MYKHSGQHLNMFGLKIKNVSSCHPLVVVGRGSETQLQVDDYLTLSSLNLPLSSSSTTSRELLSQFSTCSG